MIPSLVSVVLAAVTLSASEPPRSLGPIRGAEVAVSSATEGPGVAKHLTDRVPWRAWISQALDPKKNEHVELRFEVPRYVEAVVIVPGDGRGSKYYRAHARPSLVKISWEGGDKQVKLRDRRTEQLFTLGKQVRTRTLKVEVLSVYGPAEAGVAIGELTAFEPHAMLRTSTAERRQIEDEVADLQSATKRARALEQLAARGEVARPWLKHRFVQPHLERQELEAIFRALGARPADAAQALVSLLHSEQESARRRAEDLARTPLGRSVAKELKQLALSGGDHTRIGGAQLLCAAGSLEALDVMKVLLRPGPAPAVMSLARRCLPQYPESLPLAEGLLASSDTEEVALGLELFAGLAHSKPTRDAALEKVAAKLQSPRPAIRLASARALGTLRTKKARRLLVALAADPVEAVRIGAVEAISKMGRVASEEMAELLRSVGASEARPIIERLRSMDAEEVQKVLISASMGANADELLGAAAEKLSDGGRQGLRQLLDFLSKYPEQVVAAEPVLTARAPVVAPLAAGTLDTLSDSPHADAYRVVLIKILAASGDPSYCPLLRRMLDAGCYCNSVNATLLEALAQLDAKDLAAAIERAIDSGDPRMLEAAAKASAQLADEGAMALVVERLERTVPERWSPSIIRALGRVGTPRAVDVLVQGLPRAERPTQRAILRALSEMRSPRAMRILMHLAIDPTDSSLRMQAIHLLRDKRGA